MEQRPQAAIPMIADTICGAEPNSPMRKRVHMAG
jgi:hypothetical protein